MKNYFEDIYLEQYLTSEFTFAFELEGYASDPNWYKKNGKYWNELYNNLGDENVKEVHDVKEDSSLKSKKLGDPFEIASPIFSFKPFVISEVIKYLNWAVNNGVNTDETCGFHIHIGFPEENKELLGPMMMWIILNLIAEDKQKMFNDLKEFKYWKLYNDEYSSFSDFNTFKDMLNTNLSNEETIESFYNAIESIYNDEKYRVLRMHPQGTLEWRGARGFLDDKMRDDIKEFFTTKLYPFVRWMSKILDKNFVKVEGLIISKKEFYKYLIENFKSPVEYEKKIKPFSPYMTPEDIKNYFVLFPNKVVFRKFKKVLILIKNKFPLLLAGEIYDYKYDKIYLGGGSLKECVIGEVIVDQINKHALVTDTTIRQLTSEIKKEFADYYTSFFASSNIKKLNVYNVSFANCLRIEEGTIEYSKLWRCNLKNSTKKLRINNSLIEACDIENLVCSNTKFKNINIIKSSNLIECNIYMVDKIINSNLYNCFFSDFRNISYRISKSILQNCNIASNKYFSFNDCKVENMTFKGCSIDAGNTTVTNCIFKDINYLGASSTTFEDCKIEINGTSTDAEISNEVVFKRDGRILDKEEAITFNQ